MKIRDSGMSDETYWDSLFDLPLILSTSSRTGTDNCRFRPCRQRLGNVGVDIHRKHIWLYGLTETGKIVRPTRMRAIS